MPQPYTKARKEGNRRWDANNLDRISIAIPKGQKQAVEAHAQSKGQSVNGLVNALLRADMGLSEGEWKGGGQDA